MPRLDPVHRATSAQGRLTHEFTDPDLTDGDPRDWTRWRKKGKKGARRAARFEDDSSRGSKRGSGGLAPGVHQKSGCDPLLELK